MSKKEWTEWDYCDFADWLQRHRQIDYCELVEMLAERGALDDEIEEFEEWWEDTQKLNYEDFKYDEMKEREYFKKGE